MSAGSKAVIPKQAGSQQLSRSRAQAGDIEEYEHHASASAQAGLNLNIFAAISGVFSGKSKKNTTTNKDGSSHETVEEEGVGHVRGVGAGNLTMNAAAQAQESQRARKYKAAEQRTDHLGIEGAK